jgi:hypothetical protein
LIGKPETVEGLVEPIAAAISREHTTCPVPAMGGRRQSEHVQFSLGITEAGDGTAPVGPFSKLTPFCSGNFLSILDEARAPGTLDNVLIEDVQGTHLKPAV